jgi:hypothetical protein
LQGKAYVPIHDLPRNFAVLVPIDHGLRTHNGGFMDSDTIQVLRALCGKINEMSNILDAWLAIQSKKNTSAGLKAA